MEEECAGFLVWLGGEVVSVEASEVVGEGELGGFIVMKTEGGRKEELP